MSRYFLLLLGLFTVPWLGFAQCEVGVSGGMFGYQIFYDIFGPPGNGSTQVILDGSCSGSLGTANVKFKLGSFTPGSAANLLVVSPSSGTTPTAQGVVIAVNPDTVGLSYPGTYNVVVDFTTVDQSPTSTAPVIMTVTLFTPGPPVIQSVVNSASFDPVITPGGEVSILGTNLGPNMSGTFDQTGQYPNTLGNVTVTFNGIAAPLLSTSPGQINAVVPYGVVGQKNVQVVVTQYAQTTAQAVSNTLSVAETDSLVAMFTGAPNGTGPAGILNCNARGCAANSTANPAPAGSIVVLYATVGGVWNNTVPDGSISILGQVYKTNPVSLDIGGQAATVLYAGVPPFQVWGLFQVNAIVPNGVGSGPQPVVLTLGQTSNSSQAVTLAVQ